MTTSYKMCSMPAANCHIEIIRDGKHKRFKGVYLYSYRTLIMEICFDPDTFKLKGKGEGYTMSANWGVNDTLDMLQWYETNGKRY